VLAEYDTPDWSPDKAREWVEGQLTAFGSRVVGVYAANDGTASGAISAMRAGGLDPVPPVTGQDAELAAIQRIVAGDQYMTVYKAISQQAQLAAALAVRLLHGGVSVSTALVEGVPAALLTPVAVTRDDIKTVIVNGGVYSAEDICTPAYRQACLEIGLLEEGDT
jgi:D-xylose transport system substrate-binding protein